MKKLLLLLVLSTTTVAKPVEVYMQVQSPSPIPEAGYVTMEERKLSQIDTDDFDGFNSLFVGACVAKNSRYGNRTWNASGLIEAVSTATFLDCASWAFRHKSPLAHAMSFVRLLPSELVETKSLNWRLNTLSAN